MNSWPHATTFLLSAALSACGGLWLYCVTHKQGHRLAIDAAIETAYAALGGFGVALTLVWSLRLSEESAAAVSGTIAFAGLLGWTPLLVAAIIADFFRSENGNGINGELLRNPGSD